MKVGFTRIAEAMKFCLIVN